MGIMRKCFTFCEAVLTYSAIGTTFVMMCLTTADCLGRYFFNFPIVIAYEITEKYLMPMTLSLGLIYAYRSGALIRVTLLSDRLSGPMKLVVDNFVQLVSIIYALSLVVTTTKRAFQTKASGATLGTMNVPLWPAYLMISVGLVSMALLMILDLRRVKAGESNLFADSGEGG